MKLKVANWKSMYESDMENSKGVILSSVDSIKLNGDRHPNGIFSPFFGSSEVKNDQIESVFSCKCGELKGKFYLGAMCHKCNTIVEEAKDIIERTGWMVLDDRFCLIHPILYGFLERLIGKKNLVGIIKFERTIDEDGILLVTDDKPHMNKGMLYLRDNLDTIMDELGNPERVDVRKFIEDNRDKLFINHIPVYSLLLRDIIKMGSNVISNDINKKYNNLLGNIIALNRNEIDIDDVDLKNLPLLFESQEMINEIHKYIQKQVATKKGLIRENIMG